MLASLIGDNPCAWGGQVLIEAQVLITISRHRQDAPRKAEAGGILLGQRRGIHMHVVEATEPAPKDRRGRTHFDRSPAVHQEIATARWHRSGGTVDYVGEWHTHPEDMPSPSRIDREAWQAIYRSRAPAPMIFIIAGMSGHHWVGLGQHDALHEVRFAGR